MQIGGSIFPTTRKLATLAMAGAMTIAAAGCTDQYTPSTPDPHPTTFNSDGTISTRFGNNIISSDGTIGTQIGNTIINSNGTVGTQIGNTVINSDGTVGFKL